MRRWTRPALIITVVATVTAAGTYVAYANWIVPSKQIQIKVTSADMPRGVTPTVVESGGGALVTWKAQEIGPGARMQSYIVTAHPVSEPSLPDITHTVIASGGATESNAFPYSEVQGADWYWTLVPKFQSWVGAASMKSGSLLFPTPTNPKDRSPVIAPAEPAIKGGLNRTPGPTASSPTPSPSPTATSANSADSPIPVLPPPSNSSVPLPPPSTFTAGPPPPLGS